MTTYRDAVRSFGRASALALGVLAALTLPAPRGAIASPSMTADMPPEILSLREEILPKTDYAKLAAAWREYAQDHPQSAVAQVEWARALRYEGRAPVDERLSLLRRALELDPDCPEALDAAAGTWLGTASPLVSSLEEAIEYGNRATSLAPDWPDPHFTLWAHCLLAGRTAEAKGHLLALARQRAFPAPLVDFGYNVLASAEPSAIVFTNGDNDTYPPLALQALRDFRSDVAIVNLSLLNVPAYARQIFRAAFPDSPLTEAELAALLEGPGPPADRIVTAIVKKVQDRTWKHPVCFALTVSDSHLACCEGALRIEGLLWCLLPAAVETAGDEPPIDPARTVRLFRDEFRLESATDPTHAWGDTDAITQILSNYPAVLRIAATGSARAGRVEDVRFAMRTALRLLDAHGKEDQTASFAAYWKELEPENPEVEHWR